MASSGLATRSKCSKISVLIIGNMVSNMSDKLTIFALVYGDEFINRFFRLSLRSLIQHNDVRALKAEGVEVEFLFVSYPE